MQLKDLAFRATPTVEAMRERARQLKLAMLKLADMKYLHDALIEEQNTQIFQNWTGTTRAEFFAFRGPEGACRLVVKPGSFITNRFPIKKGALIEEITDDGLRELLSANYDNYSNIFKAVKTHYALEQYARERLSYLLADAIGLGEVHAPVFPVQEGSHKNFLLSGSLVMGSGDTPIDLITEGQHDPAWWDNEWDSLPIFAPMLREHPKLWSLICANLPFRAFIGDSDHNPGAYVLTLDREMRFAPYALDSGKAYNYINRDDKFLSDALADSQVIQKFTRFDFVEKGSPKHADMDIVLEVTNNIYSLPSEKIREIAEAVAKSVPFFVLGGQLQTVDRVCCKLEESRQALARIFNDWGEQLNEICKLPLFTDTLPEMPSAKFSSPECRRPKGQPAGPSRDALES